jgi:hypothetical protein
MLFNTRSAIASINKVIQIIGKINENQSFENIDEDELLNNIQNAIIQGAALSRYFWPPRKQNEKRGEFIRKSLGVKDDNPLKNRELRNLIEHYDEKLDAYFAKGVFGRFLPQFVGTSQGDEDGLYHVFRAYYSDAGLFEVIGEKFEIKPIFIEIIRINELLNFLEKNGGRFPFEKES